MTDKLRIGNEIFFLWVANPICSSKFIHGHDTGQKRFASFERGEGGPLQMAAKALFSPKQIHLQFEILLTWHN